MLMNGVEALATLALKDQTARSYGAQFHAEGYPDVVIDIEPQQPATDVLNEIMLLCIFFGMDRVIREREYRNAKILCFWDNVVVAQVLFERPGYQSSANTTDVLSPTAESPGGSGNISSLITTTNDTLLEAVTPRFYFRPDSQSLPTPNVFGTVITVLLAFAYVPNTDPLEAYTVVRTGAEWDVSMLFESTLIRTRPPYFEYRWAIETVRQMPGFLLQQGRFAELIIGVIVDGVHVGNALLVKGEPNDLVEKAGEAVPNGETCESAKAELILPGENVPTAK
ncbi:hypothetical protein HO133_001387 [Letharia lupina]|uniref:Uncharacterized protein n=1 Tax=Letharia lupina TaxID=560253 RepID=A0A8H6CFL2_9LECA|nr:uncharacterized protein HO133_001387 [Letharia lupina]KAF6222301.1 hypothetical protein HO133_001387 [Letharia lupina]